MSGQALERYGALFASLPVAGAWAVPVVASGVGERDLHVTAEALEAARRAVLSAASAPDAPSTQGGYEDARALDDAGRTGEAAALLARLGGDPETEVDGCLGLAVLGVRFGVLGAAQTLAARCLDRGARHPRACSILGLAALEDGHETEAQAYLAAAARIARGEAAFSDDLRAAQRVLLMMRLLNG